MPIVLLVIQKLHDAFDRLSYQNSEKMVQRDEKMEPEKDEREMTDPNLTELPVEKEYSENINRQMRVPDKIRFVHFGS